MPAAKTSTPPMNSVASVLKNLEELNAYKDLDTILDRTLRLARRIVDADAGTIFLVEENGLRFSYVHNETLFKARTVDRAVYADYIIPVDEESLVGYAALNAKPLIIKDAYAIPDNAPYSFNRDFDERTGYRTRSVLTIPILSSQGVVVGVLQIINAGKNGDNKTNAPDPLAKESLQLLRLFANHASVAIERGIMTRELILRMMKMAELRDPSETGAHVQRVGAFSAEIYHQWALNNDVDRKERKRTKDLIRLASMLHDVGKVGISDVILKKPGKLTEQEFATMQYHTVFGARLFQNSTSDLDAMSAEIALNHHEKWNGRGYPGVVKDLQCEAKRGEPKRDFSIPLSARITALADVFDALSCRRSYKEPWSEDRVLDFIENQSGKHFDPSVVKAFFSVLDLLRAIQVKYADTAIRDLECSPEAVLERQAYLQRKAHR